MFKNIVALLFVITMSHSCSNFEEQESLEDQRENILDYLDSNDLDYTSIDGVYRVVTPSQESGGLTLSEGDSLYFYFAQFLFGTTIGDAYYTNIYSVALDYDLNTEELDFNPLGIEYGTTDLLAGYQAGFQNVSEGDTLLLFITSDLAYGDKYTSVVPKNQSIASYVVIEKIVK